MRLWSLHPKHLDTRGLVALWREALLAQKVLEGRTAGYRNHPQLDRFRAAPDPVDAIRSYLRAVYDESQVRGFRFDASKVASPSGSPTLLVTHGQLLWEWKHLLAKLSRRDPARYAEADEIALPEVHPIFRVVPGDIADWERVPG
jgi:hypothetical protein